MTKSITSLLFDPVPRWDRFGLLVSTMLGVITGIAQVRGAAPLPGDAAYYWLVVPGKYEVAQYVYPPPLAQLLLPLRATDLWWVYVILWTTICFASVGYILGRWSPFALAVAFAPNSTWPLVDLIQGPAAAAFIGNVTMPMVAGIVAGMRRPGAWAIPILTKMTPGVGVLWFAFRGEWRRFATAIVWTATIAFVSFLLAPGWWLSFARFLVENQGATANGPAFLGPPPVVRVLLAIALVAVAARFNWPRLVPIACAVSLIGLYSAGSFSAIAVAALSPRLSRSALDGDPASVRQLLAGLGTWPRPRLGSAGR